MIRCLSIEEFSQWHATARIVESRFIGKEWVDVYRKEVLLLAFGENIIEEVWMVSNKRKYGFRMAITPPGLPSVGFATVLQPSDRSARIIEGLIFLRKKGFHWVHLDFPPEWCEHSKECEGFYRTDKRTYRIQTAELQEPVEMDFSPSTRNMIQKARRIGLSASESTDAGKSLVLIRTFLNRLGLAHLGDCYSRMLDKLPPESLLVVNVTREEQVLWVGLFLKTGNGVYYLAGARNTHYTENSANAFGLHFAIEYARRSGFGFFDFEGSSIPSVEKFFQGFNPARLNYAAYDYQVPVFSWIKKCKHILWSGKS